MQDRINRILFAKAGPDIIIAPKPEIRLRQYIIQFRAEICTLYMVYNELSRRTILIPLRDQAQEINMTSRVLDIEHVLAAMASSRSELNLLARQIPDLNEEAIVRARVLNDLILQGHDIVVEGKPSMTIHEYIARNIHSAIITLTLVKPIYESLKSETNLAGRILSAQSIVGGIQKAFETIPEDIVYDVISRLEPESSSLFMTRTKFNEAKSWYLSRIFEQRPIKDISFYENSLNGLIALRQRSNIVTYPPVIEMERVILRSTEILDMIDMINEAKTSPNMPLIMIKQADTKIIKVFDTISTMRSIKLEWFGESVIKRDNRMNIVLRVRPGKYHVIHYNANKNYFVVNIDRHLSMRDIMHTLCMGLNLRTLTMPQSLNATYSFITNYIDLNHHILAWLITNMPPQYRAIGLHHYVFVNENVKPNAFRDHISIHIRLGPEKVYLTISRDITTTGTIVPGHNDNLVGFEPRQPYLLIRINKAPNIHYARICIEIYRHLIDMYMAHFRSTANTIFQETGINLRVEEPRILPLEERIPSLIETYAYQDPILYLYASTISATVLPVPIEKERAQEWKDRGHAVLRLPTIVRNDPLINIPSAGEIWLRTPSPGRFTLERKAVKDQDRVEYIPIQYIAGKAGHVAAIINDDMTLTWILPDQTASYVLGENDALLNKPGRLGYVYNSVSTFLEPVTGARGLMRRGITTNVLDRLNKILNRRISAQHLTPHAHLCLGECWDQSIQEIVEDLDEGRIEPMKHFRALEKAFEINIYFLMGDDVEPYLRKPPHALFYLHRPFHPGWPCLIFHSLRSTTNAYTVMMTGTTREPKYLFADNGYLDRQMARNNIVRMVNPVTDVAKRLEGSMTRDQLGGLQWPKLDLEGWKAIEQIVDEYGKCRGITYRRGNEVVTLAIGFAPIQDLPVGEIKIPSYRGEVLAITLEPGLRDVRDILESLVMVPIQPSSMNQWRQREKEARVLRVIAHLLWSLEEVSPKNLGPALEEWMDHVQVDEALNVRARIYDLDTLTHKLPDIFGSKDMVWDYFGQLIPAMVDGEDQRIIVPSQATKDALYLHMRSMPRIQWPTFFPSLIQFSWDLKAHKDEKIFLQELDLIQYMIYALTPLESPTIIASPTSYILSRGNKRYLVQMARNMQQASSIASSWIDRRYNAGLSTPYDPDMVPMPMKEVEPDFLEELKDISYTKHAVGTENAIFLIIPL